jgi:hypothetical protein
MTRRMIDGRLRLFSRWAIATLGGLGVSLANAGVVQNRNCRIDAERADVCKYQQQIVRLMKGEHGDELRSLASVSMTFAAAGVVGVGSTVHEVLAAAVRQSQFERSAGGKIEEIVQKKVKQAIAELPGDHAYRPRASTATQLATIKAATLARERSLNELLKRDITSKVYSDPEVTRIIR